MSFYQGTKQKKLQLKFIHILNSNTRCANKKENCSIKFYLKYPIKGNSFEL